ncbi:MAG TPA: hypothetical protein VEO53_13575 [Candidatus Binatia bacterium]|nr:hypothetical protein [Candidatus Binatia bacterium]
MKPPLFWAIDLHCSRWHIRCGTRWHVLPFDGFTNCVGDLLGLVVGASAFCGFYYLGTAAPRELANGQTPELAWLKSEFNLTDAELTRITELHQAYQPHCQESKAMKCIEKKYFPRGEESGKLGRDWRSKTTNCKS